jgi:hypothetical protein
MNVKKWNGIQRKGKKGKQESYYNLKKLIFYLKRR